MKISRLLPAALVAFACASAGHSFADVKKGERNFNRCKTCHTLKPNTNRVGPSLHQVFGRKAGIVPKYRYSDSMKAASEKGLTWTRENLMAYLEDPKKFLGKYLGTKRVRNKMLMKFKKESFRKDVVDYLESLSKKEKK